MHDYHRGMHQIPIGETGSLLTYERPSSTGDVEGRGKARHARTERSSRQLTLSSYKPLISKRHV